MSSAKILLAAVLLCSCVSPTPYQKFSFPRGGYDTKPLQDGQYQIDYAANAITSQSQTEYYAIVRASEVTLESGRRYFLVRSSKTEMRNVPLNPNIQAPIVTLAIQTLPANLPGASDAVQIARNSAVAGVKLEPAAKAALAQFQ